MKHELLRNTELHVHTNGCYHPEDLFHMVKDCYSDVNWNRFGFLDRYEKVFGLRLDPIGIYDRAISTGSLDELRQASTYPYHPDGNFDEFNIKSYFSLAVSGYHLDREQHEPILGPIIERHKAEGLAYVEYRNAFSASGEEFKKWHERWARYLQESSTDSFKARYIIRIVGDPVECYSTIRELLAEQPDLVETIVGVDFSGKEIAPKTLLPFYQRLRQDYVSYPESALDAVVHIGENFFGLSLESAIRWCHQSALFGAKRLAHCIVLGMDPRVTVSRQPEAHTRETVEERMDQIAYDLEHADQLLEYGVVVDSDRLKAEYDRLSQQPADELVYRPYDRERLRDAARRQDYVLDDLARLGTVIETCPTSNLCIGGVPSLASHPFRKLYVSKTKIAICTDDPGIFSITLADEIENVCRWFGLSHEELYERVGDPWEHRLGVSRRSNK